MVRQGQERSSELWQAPRIQPYTSGASHEEAMHRCRHRTWGQDVFVVTEGSQGLFVKSGQMSGYMKKDPGEDMNSASWKRYRKCCWILRLPQQHWREGWVCEGTKETDCHYVTYYLVCSQEKDHCWPHFVFWRHTFIFQPVAALYIFACRHKQENCVDVGSKELEQTILYSSYFFPNLCCLGIEILRV